jgi:hypothetical protein
VFKREANIENAELCIKQAGELENHEEVAHMH